MSFRQIHYFSKQSRNVGACIYCGTTSGELTDEHILPAGLSGKVLLTNASCESCQIITAALERKMLRGILWPLRRRFRMASRRPSEQPDSFDANLVTQSGIKVPAKVHPKDFPELWFEFSEAAILSHSEKHEFPVGKVVTLRTQELPKTLFIKNSLAYLRPYEKVEFELRQFDAQNVMQFLAKVAHGHLCFAHGYEAASKSPLGALATLRRTDFMTFVGCNTNPDFVTRLPVDGVHRILAYERDEWSITALQFFVPSTGDPPPIYEVIIPRLAMR